MCICQSQQLARNLWGFEHTSTWSVIVQFSYLTTRARIQELMSNSGMRFALELSKPKTLLSILLYIFSVQCKQQLNCKTVKSIDVLIQQWVHKIGIPRSLRCTLTIKLVRDKLDQIAESFQRTTLVWNKPKSLHC